MFVYIGHTTIEESLSESSFGMNNSIWSLDLRSSSPEADPDVKWTQDVGRFTIMPKSLGIGYSSSGACPRNNGERG